MYPKHHLVLLIDHFDSYTHNLADLLRVCGADVNIVRTDMPFDEIRRRSATHVVLSPGPGHPRDVPVFAQAIEHWGGQVPIFGVCLGMQAMAITGGLEVGRNVRQMHGKTSTAFHSNMGLFNHVTETVGFQPGMVEVMRYHSLIPRWESDVDLTPEQHVECYVPIKDRVVASAVSIHETTPEIMGIELLTEGSPIVGVQFHPESHYPVIDGVPFYQSVGKKLMQNFLAMKKFERPVRSSEAKGNLDFWGC